jgi:uncharacterized membrane protein
MLKHRSASALLVLAVSSSPAATQDRPLVCYGNEPAWSLDLQGGVARLKEVGQEEVEFRGGATAIDALKVQAWRGASASGPSGEIVAFLSETACDDGVSDLKRPVTARVSLPDGRLLAGCCRVSTLTTVAGAPVGATMAPPENPAPPAAPPPAQAATDTDWAVALADWVSAIRACTTEDLRMEAVHFAEKKGDTLHLVLRRSGKRYVDCKVPSRGPALLNPRKKNAQLSPAEQVVVVTILPGEPPRGVCYRSEPALDDRGHPFGWTTRKGC